MTKNTQPSGSQPTKKNETVFTKGEQIQALSLLLQGRVDIFVTPYEDSLPDDTGKPNKHSFRICSLEKGIFLDGGGLFLEGSYPYSCKAAEDSTVYFFPAAGRDDEIDFITNQKDYGAYIINSLCTIIECLYKTLNKLRGQYDSTSALIDGLADDIETLNRKLSFSAASKVNSISSTISFSDRQQPDTLTEEEDIDYFLHLNNLPPELRKNFFGSDVFVTSYNCTKAAEFLDKLISNICSYLTTLRNEFAILYSNSGESLFSYCLQAAAELSEASGDTSKVFEMLDSIIAKATEIKHFYEIELYSTIDIDLTYIKCKYTAAKASAQKDASIPEISSADDAEGVRGLLPEELRNSAGKILEYSEITDEKANQFLMNLYQFRNLEDKLSIDEYASEIRASIIPAFFEIYEAVFLKAAATCEKSRLINMFLSFGYMDENLLTHDQALELYQLAGRLDELYNGNVCSMKNWLTYIYRKQREPSINEFGVDYNDVFREMKKRKEVTEKDRIKYENDVEAKVNYEVTNLFRISQKLCQGQINTYFPILHSAVINRDLSKAVITADIVKESINKILEVDFSAFHRELNYRDEIKGIEKEMIMKQVMPDIIIVPTYGSNYIMWQEIASRKRSNPGRFILPAFTDERVDDMIIKLVGNFRWELCRTIMGSAWNDLTVPSLTSEYTDYIQFFKKNKELSDEAKDKLKAQILKCHSKSRDIFTSDYETWVRNESKGSVRLNKVVRSILYRHCPFVKPIREQLERSPIFSEVALKQKAIRSKMARDLENRYMRYAKQGPLDQDLKNNLHFYKDM